jgi:pSer/pThr/pTyr-binding forkhead associated (FHA) protein
MNGVKVDGQRIVDNRILTDGDQVMVGATALLFQEGGREEKSPQVGSGARAARRARLLSSNGDNHVLASETLLGRAVTSDIVVDDPGVSTKHARIVAPDATTYYLEDLDSATGTWLNGERVAPRRRELLADEDRIGLGAQEFRFQTGAAL